LKYDNATATFNLEADETGTTPVWSSITDPTADLDLDFDSGETTAFNFDDSWSTGNQFAIISDAGDQGGGILFNVIGNDDNIAAIARFGDSSGSHYWEISETASNVYTLRNAGSAIFNVAAASDLQVGGAQIDFNDMAQAADVTTSGTISGTTLTDGLATLSYGNLSGVTISSIAAASDLSGAAVTLGTVAGTITDGTASWDTSTQTLSGFSTISGTTLSGTTMVATAGTLVIGDNSDQIQINGQVAGANDGYYDGWTREFTVDSGATAVFGQAYHVDTDWELINANSGVSTTMPAIGLAVEAGTGAGIQVLVRGMICETDWNWSGSSTIYVSTDPDDPSGVTDVQPSTSGDIVQIVGLATSADCIEVTMGGYNWVEVP